MPHVESTGAGHTALMFVHGFCCDRRDWAGLIERLSGKYRCVAIDLPRHGHTSAGAPGMQGAGAAVNLARRSMSLDKVILIGHSLGCKTIREAYRQDPGGIGGLILVDGSLYLSDRETMLANADAAVAGGMEAFLSGLFGRMFDDTTPEALKSFLIDRAINRDLDAAKALFLDSVDWDTRFARQTIESLKVPTMVIQATTFDSQFRWRPLGPGESTGLIDTMRAHVEDFEAVVIPEAGHFVMADQPDLTTAAIDRFAARVFGAAA